MDKEIHSGHRMRVREKILKGGFELLYPHEFLEFVLFGAVPRADTNALAHRLISEFGSVENVFSAPIEKLLAVEGVGKSVALSLKSYEYAANFVKQRKTGVSLKNLGDVKDYLYGFFLGTQNEEFHSLLLDKSGKLVYHDVMKSDSQDRVYVDMERIVALVTKYKPSGIIFAHNHPSNDVTPSREDVLFTQKYLTALKFTFNIELCDHFIFAKNGDCYSFRQNGTLEKIAAADNQQ